MGYTKKQRREQKKRPFVPTNKAQAKKIKRQAYGASEQKTTLDQGTTSGQDMAMDQQELSMVLVKTCWTEPGGDARQNFQLVEISAGRNQEQIRQEFLNLLQARRMQDCMVEIFDPNNVPPGTIPASATVTLSQPLFSK